jgi:hypothetical protein
MKIKVGMQMVNIITDKIVYKIRIRYPIYLLTYFLMTSYDNDTKKKYQKGAISLYRAHSETIKKVKNNDSLKELFAIKDISKLLITQERVQMFEEYQNCDNETFENIVEMFFKANENLMQYGMAENTFNFYVNAGILDGKGVIVDFGELATTKEEAIDNIQNKKWQTQWNYKILSDEKKAIFDEKANTYWSIEHINKIWGIKGPEKSEEIGDKNVCR